ncbi:RES family NAD+ phosphorylase [Legionella qingyii]|nr:RES family NAD+ phosphorylase [Legionella qingyii]RUR18340.1 RES domain-containing protein [Legionella qingyii]RUR21418.1 RES domain-containing protein [Legionella qingyii]
MDGKQYITPIMATIHRVVEDQEELATLSLVNNIEEQAILEELLETSKPKRPEEYEDLHYLLITPFRYPPLQYGSRFGNTFEPSLFYGSLNVSTALAETAYYRFVFMAGMKEPYTDSILMTYSSYTIGIKTVHGIFLNKQPFNTVEQIISSPKYYSDTQKLGSSMRKANVEAFQYSSTRDPEKGINVALFTPKALQSKKPISIERWICNITNEEIGFISNDNHNRLSFNRDLFLVDGLIPAPAC